MLSLLAVTLPAAAAPAVELYDPVGGSLRDRLAPPDDASVVLLYAGEHDGELGPCGCGRGGLGGLPRLLAWADAVRAAEGARPVLLLDPGGTMSSVSASDGTTLTGWSQRTNAWMHEALYRVRFDAFNVGYRDLPGITAAPHPGMVSATHRPAAAPVARYATFAPAGGPRIAVTGVSRRGLDDLQPPGTQVGAPVSAVRALLPELEADGIDLVVVLAHEVAREAAEIAALPGVDVVIEAGSYGERWPPTARTGAVWVRSMAEGTRAGELRLWLDGDGNVVRAVDRQLPLDDAIPSDPALLRLQRGQDEED